MSKSKRKRKRKPREWAPEPWKPVMSDTAFFTQIFLLVATIVAIVYFSYTEVYRPLVGGPRLGLQTDGIAFYAALRLDEPMPAGALSPSILTPESRAWASEYKLAQMPDAALSRMVDMPARTRFKQDKFAHMAALRRLDHEPERVLNEWGGTIQVYVGEGGVLVAYDGVPRRLCEYDFERPTFSFAFQCNGKFQYRY